MIRVNLLPHREERRKRRKVAFFIGLGIAAAAGLASGDRIVDLNGVRPAGRSELRTLLAATEWQQRVGFLAERGGEQQEVAMLLYPKVDRVGAAFMYQVLVIGLVAGASRPGTLSAGACERGHGGAAGHGSGCQRPR